MSGLSFISWSFISPTLSQKTDALRLWGQPTTFADIAKLFSRFCLKDLSALPWCDQEPAIETSVISRQLAEINELGFLTINSQPAVNGAPSDDKVFGWGPSNGYVYQKVTEIETSKLHTLIRLEFSGILRILCPSCVTLRPSLSHRTRQKHHVLHHQQRWRLANEHSFRGSERCHMGRFPR